MIGKVKTGESFRGCLMYCLHDKELNGGGPVVQDRAEVLLYNRCFGSDKELIQQFSEVRLLNQKLAKPVLHLTLSLAPGEQLPKDKWMELAAGCAQELGFQHNQYLAVLHKDTGHQHLHLVVNRVGFDKRTLSDSKSYKKVAAFCRKVETRFGLRQVHSPNRFLPKEQQVQRLDSRKEGLRMHVEQVLGGCRTLALFEERMKGLGYQVLRGRGIAFLDGMGVRTKGSEIGYPLNRVEQLLAQQEVKQEQSKSTSSNEVSAGKCAGDERKNEAGAQVVQPAIGGRHQEQHSSHKALEQMLRPEQGGKGEAADPNHLKKKRVKQRKHTRL
ncbi:Relaxase/Mobilisation nuclease domain-containing protein [Cnuella takakiae]|uniref:Relaxase/Mobilisation nuclease domain-containing protein n=1 Tax=Cnuella takakiae TaxID=1302690 RepID=A0A1M5CG49_9BACT|nr:relaxase/mobilization nuclease domain-containing protein [Cnuella takakiae]OLY91807.1 hypothetical protein BUE76_07765 [Cnuella takakiae]SHF53577.1 Relaxase/Mobilisation nuclease domain-containing protein [Cnuella takakiae]